MIEPEKKELALERVLFFSDAIVAIAITLLALELKIDIPEERSLTYADLLKPWHQYLAFLLSFINISSFWNLHYRLFMYIKKMNDGLKFYNTAWLFFIVVLPFSTSVLSGHFSTSAAVSLYTINILLISVFQRFLWKHAVKNDLVDTQEIDEDNRKRFNVFVSLDLGNAVVALVISFMAPVTAFILLFFKIPLWLLAIFYNASQRRKGSENEFAKLRRFGRN